MFDFEPLYEHKILSRAKIKETYKMKRKHGDHSFLTKSTHIRESNTETN
jgi:hypothetical protein